MRNQFHIITHTHILEAPYLCCTHATAAMIDDMPDKSDRLNRAVKITIISIITITSIITIISIRTIISIITLHIYNNYT